MTNSEYAVKPVAVSAFLVGISTLALILRFISRRRSKAGFWWDDWLALAAWPFSVTLSISLLVAGFHGFGQHNNNPTFFAHVMYFDEKWYFTGIALTKLSVLCFYYRIFSRDSRFHTMLYITGTFVIISWITLIFVSIFQCIPIRAYWDPNVEARCVRKFDLNVGSSVPNILADFVLLILPIKPLWGLRMKRTQRIALLVVFVLGYFNPIISVLRMFSFIQTGKTTTEEEANYNYVSPALWTATEVAIAIFSSSIPSLTYTFREIMDASRRRFVGKPSRDCEREKGSFTKLSTVPATTHGLRQHDATKNAFISEQTNRIGTTRCEIRCELAHSPSKDRTALDTSGQIFVTREVNISTYQMPDLGHMCM